MYVRRGVSGSELVVCRGVGRVWVPWVRVDLEIGEGHRGHLSWEEAQVVGDYIEIPECVQLRDFWRDGLEPVVPEREHSQIAQSEELRG